MNATMFSLPITVISLLGAQNSISKCFGRTLLLGDWSPQSSPEEYLDGFFLLRSFDGLRKLFHFLLDLNSS